jgi:hypothetical protein
MIGRDGLRDEVIAKSAHGLCSSRRFLLHIEAASVCQSQPEK